MKYYLGIILFLTLSMAAGAQSNKSVERFGKRYFKHFKKKDLEWIMKKFLSEQEYITYNQETFPNSPSLHDLQRYYKKARREYELNVKELFNKNSLPAPMEFMKVEVRPHPSDSTDRLVKIIFTDDRNTEYYLIPGLIRPNKRMKPAVFDYWVTIDSTYGLRSAANADSMLSSTSTLFVDTIENKIWEKVDSAPKFSDGEYTMKTWLRNNVKYPTVARELGVTGNVYVEMIVNKDGSLSNIEIARDIGYGCGMAVVKAIRKMPKWTPGTQNGKAVNVRYVIGFRFSR